MNLPEFTLLYPRQVTFGCGCRAQLPDILQTVAETSGPRVLLVTIRAVRQTGVLGQFVALCGGDRVCTHFTGVPHDPPLSVVDAIVAAARDASADVIVGVGGGSVIDAAKAAAVLVPAAGTTRDYFYGERSFSVPGLPLIALPTTAGTGAEITKNAVLTDPDTGVKKSLRSAHMVPCAALVDPELTLGLPPSLTAHSGLDALTQAIESYISVRAHAVSRALAGQAVARLMSHLPQAVRDGNDKALRTAVAEGSLLSAMAFSQSGLGAVHGLAHPIGAVLGTAHGLTCAVLLPYVLRWNAPVREQGLGELACLIGRDTAAQFVEDVVRLCRQLGIPADFADLGLREGHFEHIVAHCRSGSMKANPRPMTDDDVIALLSRLAA